MAKNNLQTLNDVLFEQIERINDDELTGSELREQIDKSKAIADMARQIITNGRLMLDAQRTLDRDTDNSVPSILLTDRTRTLRLEDTI